MKDLFLIKILKKFFKDWGLSSNQPSATKITWDAAALVDKTISVRKFIKHKNYQAAFKN